nr:immunoglobulin light chain junction region [Macaca mulatta]
CQKYSTTPFTF